jgi:hypothetical protein
VLVPEVGTEVGKPKPRRLTELGAGPQRCVRLSRRSVWVGRGVEGKGLGVAPCGQRESGRSGTSRATGWKGPVLWSTF